MVNATDTEQGLAARVRSMTRADHEAAETTSFVADLMSGRLDLTAYARLATQHYFIYETLEQAASAMRTDPVAGGFVDFGLDRLPALGADLHHLRGPRWRSEITPLPATRDYLTRLRAVAFTDPPAFVAHHYTRYLGDLSGGQMVKRALRREYGVDAEGTSFYEFPGVAAGAVKRRYRELLDEAPWSAAEQDRFIDEVKRAFAHNRAVFEDLATATAA
ncbi:biliverdin-producing heme oxygenase [Asanoa iriomotensis]|uniref:Biliverdin-producing heme oxygenase n=1 Tax=Asanoa iriomotensis TaxID=234613 RepID=A0ABQ4C7I5_9ACTN|nr:biliverdin-producing heme oxygenase [Asanoa iriomotensis]GIF58748.1 biliverdin-producing heme oxygenase [Asanoa iriomotensis]